MTLLDPTRICKDCGSTVARHWAPVSYVYPDGQSWLCWGKCNKTGFGVAQPTRKTVEKPAQDRLPLDGAE